MSNELSLQDRNLVDKVNFGYTPEEIATQTGIPAMVVVQRIKDSLQSHNLFTWIERRQLLLNGMYKLYESVSKAYDPSDPKSVGGVVQVMRAIMDMLDKQKGVSEEELREAARMQATAMMELIERGYLRARELLAEEHPDVDLDRIDEVFYLGMKESTRVDDTE